MTGTRDLERHGERRRRLSAALALGLFTAVYAGIVFSHMGRSVGGSDSSGYYNAARALAAGQPVERIDFPSAPLRPEEFRLFIPLGYVPGPTPGTMAPFYPMGLPLHFAAAAALWGWDLGPFLVSPAAAVLSLPLLFLVGRRLGLSRLGALAAAAMLAAVPVFSFFAVNPMGDGVSAAWALATLFLALESRRRPICAVAAGFAFGVGVLVRPTSAILILPLFFALETRLRVWAMFAAGGVPCAAALLAFNRVSYGSMLRSGYGVGGALADFKWANFPARLRHYSYWIAAMSTPLVPAAWLLLAWDGRRPIRTRLLLLSWFASLFLLYCFYGPHDAWWYTRYLLPGIPALLIGAVMWTEGVLSRIRAAQPGAAAGRLRFARAAAAIAFVVICLVGVRLGRHYRVLQVGRDDASYPESIRWAAARVPSNGLVVAMQFSGAMRAYGWGRLVRWDWMDAERFPDFRRRMEGAGYRFYALLFPFEVGDFAARLPGDWRSLGAYGDKTLWELAPRQ